MRVFLAGASGAIGRPLVRLLCEAGHEVTGTARTAEGQKELRRLGCSAVDVDVFDAAKLVRVVADAGPDVVIHQLTALPRDARQLREPAVAERNARIRREGTPNLVRAAERAGARRLVAQSIAWAYAPGQRPHVEDDPLDLEADGIRRVSVDGVVALERSVLGAVGIKATVLRYGQIYGPGTSTAVPKGASPVHVEAAAWAAVMALRHAQGGVFNIAEDNAEVSSEKAKRELGWYASLRLPKGLAA